MSLRKYRKPTLGDKHDELEALQESLAVKDQKKTKIIKKSAKKK